MKLLKKWGLQYCTYVGVKYCCTADYYYIQDQTVYKLKKKNYLYCINCKTIKIYFQISQEYEIPIQMSQQLYRYFIALYVLDLLHLSTEIFPLSIHNFTSFKKNY